MKVENFSHHSTEHNLITFCYLTGTHSLFLCLLFIFLALFTFDF